ncbi:uncharacterized protein LOC6647871 [Drosophila willistoni]|uniref:uncharacterized protein LOC6647871 n=1 Tax=Drosophila willistoni TaxID=7260 RepID=UPI000C26D602|nr:uncharacterized protein LOC6647871 [Drosophila willistoni]
MSLLVAICLILAAAACSIVQANVLFHFSLDFHVKQPQNGKLINKTIIVEDNRMSLANDNEEESTSAPQWTAEENEYNVVAVAMLEKTRSSIQLLNSELAPLVGRSNDLAVRLKQSMRYVNEVDGSLENRERNLAQHVEMLRKYVQLVNSLREPSPLGGVRSLEYVLIKLAVEKYDLLARQQEVNEYLQRLETVWNEYKNTQVVLLEN